MKKNLTEMVFVLDRSGSMDSLTKETIGGYNSLIRKQRDEEGEAIVTTCLFDDKVEYLYEATDISKVSEMTRKEYYARGCTALYDAIGYTIKNVANRHENSPSSIVPEKTIVVIMTDGYENASREYSNYDVKRLIDRQKEKFGWEFLFLGANIDVEKVAYDVGIDLDKAVKFDATPVGMRANFTCMDEVVTKFRRK